MFIHSAQSNLAFEPLIQLFGLWEPRESAPWKGSFTVSWHKVPRLLHVAVAVLLVDCTYGSWIRFQNLRTVVSGTPSKTAPSVTDGNRAQTDSWHMSRVSQTKERHWLVADDSAMLLK